MTRTVQHTEYENGLRGRARKVGKRPELELLLCCARTNLNPEDSEKVRLLIQRDLDWNYFVERAQWHRVVTLVYRNLNTVCPEAVPQSVLERLRKGVHATAAVNLFKALELIRFYNLFQAHGIHVIPYKGPVLAASVYGDISLRQFGDLDILVRLEDVLKAKDLLLAEGCQPYQHPSPAEQAAYFRTNKDFKFKWKGFTIELHWQLALHRLSFPFDPTPLWESAETVSLLDTEVLNLSPENLLIILCANGCKDRWVQLSYVCDIAELLRTHQAIEWERVLEQAAVVRSQRMLFLGLYLAHSLLQAPLPEWVIERIHSDPTVTSLAKQVIRWLNDGALGPRWGLKKTISSLRTREKWRDSVPSFLHVLGEAMRPTEKDKANVQLPAPLQWSYVLIRPFRLLRRYITS